MDNEENDKKTRSLPSSWVDGQVSILYGLRVRAGVHVVTTWSRVWRLTLSLEYDGCVYGASE